MKSLNIKKSNTRQIAFTSLMSLLSIILFSSELIAEDNQQENKTPIMASGQNVTFDSFESLSFYPKNSAPAIVVAINQSDIPAEVRGVVDKIHVQVGQVVEQGQLLAELKCYDVKINLTTETANLELLEHQQAFQKREVARGLKLFQHRNLGEAEFDSRKMELQSLNARVKAQASLVNLAKYNRAACFIKAPFSGVVLSRMASVGEMLERGAPLLSLLQSDLLEVSAQVALSHNRFFKQAKDYAFQTKQHTYSLELRTVVNAVASGSLSLEARLVFSNELAIAGLSGRLVWRSALIHLPAHLLQKREGKYGVFIADSKRAQFIKTPNAQEGRPFSIDAELWSGQKIIVDGRHGLKDGQAINVLNQNKKQLKIKKSAAKEAENTTQKSGAQH